MEDIYKISIVLVCSVMLIQLIFVVQAFEFIIKEGSSKTIKCSTDIFINKATWSRNRSTNCFHDVTLEIKKICHRQFNCFLEADRNYLGSKCSLAMELTVDYECIDCKKYHSHVKHKAKNPGKSEREVNYSGFCRPSRGRNLLPFCPRPIFETTHICLSDDYPGTVSGAQECARDTHFNRVENRWQLTQIISVISLYGC